MSFFKLPKPPSRNMSIFWTSVGAIVGLRIYDQNAKDRVIQDFTSKASQAANQIAPWNDRPRKVVVFLEPTGWSKYWFEEFVKPVFDAGALDYDLIDEDHPSLIVDKVKEVLWNAKESFIEENRPVAVQSKSWFAGYSQQSMIDKQQVMYDKMYPHLKKVKYDQSMSLIAIGPNAWKHILYGVIEGSYTSRPIEVVPEVMPDAMASDKIALDDVNLPHPSVEYPVLGFIPSAYRGGFIRFHYRVAGWFNRRANAEECGQEALKIVLNQCRSYNPDDAYLGSESFVATEKVDVKAKNVKPQDVENDKLTTAAESLEVVPLAVAERLLMNRMIMAPTLRNEFRNLTKTLFKTLRNNFALQSQKSLYGLIATSFYEQE
ncbi:inner membrane protein import complex subunit Tim54-domain-containing protein [Globomyces pollinis-pini]|nr:inner membrane protein import complex subunit Tim54-domain-containing protein [Globomyces pollinis-pini]